MTSLAWYKRPCRSGPHLLSIISRHKPLPAILHCSHSQNTLCLFISLFFYLLFFLSGVPFPHLSLPGKNVLIFQNLMQLPSFLSIHSWTPPGKNVNHCLFIVLWTCCNYADAFNHCTSVSFTWLWASEIRIEFYFIRFWPRMGHLVVLDKCSINESTKKRNPNVTRKYSKYCWCQNDYRLGSSYLKKWFYYIILWISENYTSKEMRGIALEVDIFRGFTK